MKPNFDQVTDRRTSNSIKWNAYHQDTLPLWVADMDFRVPEPILQALRGALEHGILGYEAPTPALRQTVADRMKNLYGWEIDPQSVVPITGLVSGFYAAAGALCQPGEGYLIQPPVYMPFNDIQKHLGIIRQEAPLQLDANAGRITYHIDWDAFAQAFHSGGSKTRMFLLCNPHNPTGQAYTPAELTRMAEISLQNGAVIVSDEIHSELLLGETRHTPIASLSPHIAQQTITLIAPSKTFNIPGLFSGFAIIPNPQLRQQYQRQTEKMTLHVNSLGLIAAQAAFSGECDGWLTDLRAYLTANRDALLQFVQERLPGIASTHPQATYLAWMKIPNQPAPAKYFLEHAKIALNEGATFGTGGQGFVRLNFGCPRPTLNQALQQLQTAWEPA